MARRRIDPHLYSRALRHVADIEGRPESQRPAAAEALFAELASDPVLRETVRNELGMAAPAASPAWTEGMVVNGYTLVRPLGQGGQADVWLADKITDAEPLPFALKFVRSGAGNFDAIRREVQLQTRAGQNAWVNPVVDVFRVGTYAVIASQYSSEGTVADLLHRRNGVGLPPEQALAIVADALRGIVHLHHHEIVHRDLKPANVLKLNDTYRLIDFGLARDLADLNLRELVGTLPYLPPELLAGKPLPPPMTDVWAAGVMLYEVVIGRRPYPDGVATWEPPPALPNEVPPLVRAIIEKALSEKPEDRYQTAAEMLEAVAQAQRRTRPLSGPSAAIAVKVAKKERSRRWMVGVWATALTGVAVAVYVLFFAERVPIVSTDFSVPTALHVEAWDLGHQIRNEIVTDVNPRVGGCQARALGRGMGGRGTLAMSFTVRGNGSVANVNVGGTAPMDEVMRRCLVRAAGQRAFANWAHEEAIAMVN